MTHPNPLPPSSQLQIAAMAYVMQGAYGMVTDLARDYEISRQHVYDLRERGRAALETEFAATEPKPRGSFTLEVAPADMARAVVALRVATPASIRDIVEVLPLVFGTGYSYGKVWDLLHDAEQRAAALLEAVDVDA